MTSSELSPLNRSDRRRDGFDRPFALLLLLSVRAVISRTAAITMSLRVMARLSRTGLKHCMRRSSREDKDVIHSKFAVGRKLFMAGAARISDRIEATAYEQAQKLLAPLGSRLKD